MNQIEKVFSIVEIAPLLDDDLMNGLSEEINKMILTNFESLVQLLYRIDVSEMKLKTLLKEMPEEDAGKIIARLIIERQIQKINFKKQASQQSDVQENNTGEEQW
jgi:hypothetical protein